MFNLNHLGVEISLGLNLQGACLQMNNHRLISSYSFSIKSLLKESEYI